MKLQDIISVLEEVAPPDYQEGYDNSGLLMGDADKEVTSALISLDCTPEVVAEAVNMNCNLIIAHHPIIFKGLKRLTGSNYVEKTIIQAIKNDIAIYAIHTNLDNVLTQGVNSMIARKLGLSDTQILAPKSVMTRLDATGEPNEKDKVVEKLGGLSEHFSVGYNHWEHNGTLFFQISTPHHLTGQIHKLLAEANFSVQRLPLDSESPEIGSGLIGSFPEPMTWNEFFEHLKQCMGLSVFRHTKVNGKGVQRVALCGGAGSFLLPEARNARADVFLSADFKYHEFFDAENDIVIVDIGHYESERYTIDLIEEIISKKIRNFAARKSEYVSNPVKYYK